MDDLKVLLVNGSPHEKGCTYTALCEISAELEKQGIYSEIFHVGHDPVAGCLGCAACTKADFPRCIQNNDCVNDFIVKAAGFDGYVFGSPVHYAAASGMITSFMDRVFYAGGSNLAYKPAAAVMSCRRGGATATLDQLNKYFLINKMPVVSSQYWNMVHGSTPSDVLRDEEGLQTMRTLARNMAWILKCIKAGAETGISVPEAETPIKTNFIR